MTTTGAPSMKARATLAVTRFPLLPLVTKDVAHNGRPEDMPRCFEKRPKVDLVGFFVRTTVHEGFACNKICSPMNFFGEPTFLLVHPIPDGLNLELPNLHDEPRFPFRFQKSTQLHREA